ncbi:MAG: methyltransferase domain-containing protein [Anaerolineae bacterium]|nr:methyltransferase domain-containing protein [Anaerolineae bacterium]
MRLDHFGLVAPIYERVIRTPDLGRLRAVADLQPTDRLLDVGGGTGRVSMHLESAVASAWVLDFSHGMLRQAVGKGLDVCQGAAEALPFSDGAFDKIVAIDSFHHFVDHQRAAQELLRVLAPGGRLTIEEPDIRRFAVKLVALGETLALMRSRFWRPDELAGFFRGPTTSIKIHAEDHTYWLTVDKTDLHRT